MQIIQKNSKQQILMTASIKTRKGEATKDIPTTQPAKITHNNAINGPSTITILKKLEQYYQSMFHVEQ